MPKYDTPPSPDLTENEIDALMVSPLSADVVEALSAPEPEFISIGELLLLNVETRIGRMADALEAANKIKTADRNDIAGLTAQVSRLADAFEAMAGFIVGITESVEGQDGVARCYVRTRDDNHGWLLSERDDRDSD